MRTISPARLPANGEQKALRLTELSSGAGCGCKLPAAELLPIVQALGARAPQDERLLVGPSTGDDAAVYRLDDELALVHTIDFFTPVVDDPYDFGRIAAANALSDVYAMGGTPLLALNVVAFPLERLGSEVLGEILRGGADVVAQAGAVLAGGHSIEDAEPKYGLAVTGALDPGRLLTNAGAREGDALVLTKPLGAGAIVTAHKRGICADEVLRGAVDAMIELNAAAATAALAAAAHAMTDVTGFGLVGHLHHLCRESGLSAGLDAAAVPVLAGAEELLAGEQALSGGSRRNAAWAEGFCSFEPHVPRWRRHLLCDATTSGGLLVALPAQMAGEVPGSVIGRLARGTAGTIAVR